MSQQLPPMAPYPEEEDWKTHIAPAEWEVCLDSWIALGGAHLDLSDSAFQRISLKDETLIAFIITFVANLSSKNRKKEEQCSFSEDSAKLKLLRKLCFLLSCRLLENKVSVPMALLSWEFLANASKVYGRRNTSKLYSLAKLNHCSTLEASTMSLKSSLIKELDAGINGNLNEAELQLKKLNLLLYTCHEIAHFFMAGSDYLDALISGYKIMNPPLRKAIISNIYLCLIGLTKGKKPNFSLLVDQLYSLKAAAELHRDSISNANDSLVPELLTITPILKKLEQRVNIEENGSGRAKGILSSLQSFRKSSKSERHHRTVKRKIDKGKNKAVGTCDFRFDIDEQSHVQRLSLISQVQELLPDLGSEFISNVLKEYDDNVEVAISHILEETFPPHLEELKRTENLQNVPKTTSNEELKTQKTYSTLPARHNVFDDDKFDRGEIDASCIHFGHRDSFQTTKSLLDDRSSVLKKEAIFSALAAFDLDDDEHDDTYDFADVGGTVDMTNPEDDLEKHTNNQSQIIYNETLFRAYKMNSEVFKRDGVIRRGKEREKLRQKVGLTDEVIEGWALMLGRNPKLQRKLEASFDGPGATLRKVVVPSWKNHELKDTDDELPSEPEVKKQVNPTRDSDVKQVSLENNKDSNARTARRGGRINNTKGPRVNHNRKNQRAKKIAKGFSGPEG